MATSNMGKPRGTFDLGRRERQIMEVVYRLRAASVREVRGELERPPSYSAVRTMLGKLEEKGVVARRIDGPRHIFYPTTPVKQAQLSSLERLVQTLFGGSRIRAMQTLLDLESAPLSDDDLEELARLIESKRSEAS